MNERQKRLIEVYEHLRRYFGIHTKTGFAKALHYGRTSLSAAMNGDESYLTDNLFKNICETYPKTFNLDYLLTGKGSLLTVEEEVKSEEIERKFNFVDQSSLINAALAAKDETIYALRDQLAAKDNVIQAKDELISALRQQITILKQTGRTDEPFRNYPFEIGVAEESKRPVTQV
jgi:hypothetical protein